METQSTALGPCLIARRAGPGHFQKHTSQFLCATPRVSSNIQLDFKLDPFPPLPFFFLKRGIPPFSFNPISPSRSCQESQAQFTSDSSLFPWGEPSTPQTHTVPWASSCLWKALRPCQQDVGRVPCPEWRLEAPPGPRMSIRPWYPSELARRRLHAQSQHKEQPSRGFYLQPADNEVEIDRSCRQQVTPSLSVSTKWQLLPLLPGQEVFNSFWLSPGFTGVSQVSTMVLFMPSLSKCSSTPFGWVASNFKWWEWPKTSRVTHLLYPSVAGQILLLQPPACQVSTQSMFEQFVLFLFLNLSELTASPYQGHQDLQEAQNLFRTH